MAVRCFRGPISGGACARLPQKAGTVPGGCPKQPRARFLRGARSTPSFPSYSTRAPVAAEVELTQLQHGRSSAQFITRTAQNEEGLGKPHEASRRCFEVYLSSVPYFDVCQRRAAHPCFPTVGW